MSRWPGCGGAAESRRGEVASILRETEQKTAIHTLNQSEPSSLIVGSVHMSKSGVEETSVLWCFFNLFGVLIPIDGHYTFQNSNDLIDLDTLVASLKQG